MAHYMDQIKTLAAAAGYSTNPSEMVPLWILENEIDILSAKNQHKHQIGKILEDILEKKRLELKAEQEISEKFALNAQADVKKFKEKNMILVQYMSILQTEEFLPNKFIRKIHSDEQEYYTSMKSFIDKARVVAVDLGKLQELQAKCDELRQQTAQ